MSPNIAGKAGLHIFTIGGSVKHSHTFRNTVICSKSFVSIYTLLHGNSTHKYLS